MTIEIETKEHDDKEIFGQLNGLVSSWFKNKFKTFSPPQKGAILNIHNRRHTLITAPTGSGKTFAAFTAVISELVTLAQKDELQNKVYCLYISPLKALNNDIKRNLLEPLEEISTLANKDLGIKALVRTEDTKTSEKAKMLTKAPHILITTPETLGILLVAPKFRELMRDIKWVIVDEIHALASNKRGVHLSLSLERLQNLAGNFTRVGLSATIAPIEKIAEYLVGCDKGESRNCKIVNAQFIKKLDLKVLSPVENIMDVSEAQLAAGTYEMLHELIQKHKTTLVFTNTRAATERVVFNLKKAYPKFYNENIEAHHSSLSRELRLSTEQRLKEGKLKVVVSSTSLELGIDIGSIDLVILLGSPKSVSRALQRIGRSGHKLMDDIMGRFVVIDRDDLVEDAMILKHAIEKQIDQIEISENCLDVLSQQIYGMAIEEMQHIDTIYSTVQRSYCYRNLPKDDFISVIKYLAGDYAELEYRNVYAKIWYDSQTGFIGKRGKLARVLYSTNIGTIPDESYVLVKIKDQVVGKIDEEFLMRLKKGDIFVLGGQTYRFDFSRGMVAQVTATPGKVPTIPSWFSDMLPLNFEVALGIQKFRRLMEEKFNRYRPKQEIMDFIKEHLHVEGGAANSIYEYFKEQWDYASMPHDQKLVVENLFFDNKHYIVFHSCFGRRVNDALSRAIAYLASKMNHVNLMVSITDQNFYLVSKIKLNFKEILEQLKKENIPELLKLAIDNTDILKRRFRHCAGRGLLIIRNYKGNRKSVGRQQVSSQILINACKRVSRNFPILKEAQREVLEDLMDMKNTVKVVNWIKDSVLKIKEIETSVPSPFALNLIARGYSDIMRAEDRLEFIKRMHNMILAKIGQKKPK
ncbi:MAG TPA: ATP-dependent helicase [Candidatus Nanoarchaeia archaeon]|nr:ATP-dependent helicase [Candidatus Nanoarchaeia archaeon]